MEDDTESDDCCDGLRCYRCLMEVKPQSGDLGKGLSDAAVVVSGALETIEDIEFEAIH